MQILIHNKDVSMMYQRILDERNIFSAIYSLESYVFEKGLLDTKYPVFLFNEEGIVTETIASNDLELYYALSDKHNMVLIEKVIRVCQLQLQWLFADKSNLFEAKVYFKLKGLDEKGKLKFRPLHIARLTDLICMVSILNCLMYEDDYTAGVRSLSDLSKLVPHNFYGNIPSTDVQYLFHRWQTKYKEYTENVITHCRRYQNNHNYLTEVSLDIKNFFPSISPKLLYNYIVEKLRPTYSEDLGVLKTAVAKLLYFKISPSDIERWKEYYYPDNFDAANAELYMTCGIPQGLPQSYFFGNLCMINIENILMKEEYFKGDAYFYVDDSVIYVQSALKEDDFKRKIKHLNNDLRAWCIQNEEKESDISLYVSDEYIDFHSRIKYIIEFHENDKSIFTPIDTTENHLGPIANLTRETSISSKLSVNLDEIDDRISLGKLNALNDVISREIEILRHKEKEAGHSDNKVSSRLKLLKRFKKFFLYRNRLLKIRDDGGPNNVLSKDFEKMLSEQIENLQEWFDLSEEDIFQSEYRLLIQKQSKTDATVLSDKVKNFERKIVKVGADIDDDKMCELLFFAKDVENSLLMKSLSRDVYWSLIRWAKENLSGYENLNTLHQMNTFREFLSKGDGSHHVIPIYDMMKYGFENKGFTTFVIKASSEYQRRVLNVYFSQIIGIVSSDALSFVKSNSRKLRYTELRILAYLRNRDFDLEQFEEFVEHIDDADISNSMSIDMGLLDVLNRFISNVRKPEWVDSLIVTHRLTKGLWYNGSKFLNSYTLHNEEHAVTLINKSLELVNRIDYFVLKEIDYYILFLACYLHDISMVIHPDLGRLSASEGSNIVLISDLMGKMRDELNEFRHLDSKDSKNARIKRAGNFLVEVFNKVYSYFEGEVRDNHAIDSANFVRENSKALLSYLEPTLLSFVAKVSESHGYDVLDVYGLKSRAKDDTVSLKYIMILIRLADLLDVANDRVNYHLLRQNFHHLSLTSKFHWISHLVTDKIELNTCYISDKEDKRLDEKPIIEDINLDLYLNVKQLTSVISKKCEHCICRKNDDRLSVEILNSFRKRLCNQESCTVLCYWMMKKHEWLIPELVALNDYLLSVNTSLIKTQIHFNIHYRNTLALDPDMLDSVQEYLTKMS